MLLCLRGASIKFYVSNNFRSDLRLVFGAIDVGIMLPMSFPDKKAAITAAFVARFAIGCDRRARLPGRAGLWAFSSEFCSAYPTPSSPKPMRPSSAGRGWVDDYRIIIARFGVNGDKTCRDLRDYCAIRGFYPIEVFVAAAINFQCNALRKLVGVEFAMAKRTAGKRSAVVLTSSIYSLRFAPYPCQRLYDSIGPTMFTHAPGVALPTRGDGLSLSFESVVERTDFCRHRQ